jgi:hypothetical protein
VIALVEKKPSSPPPPILPPEKLPPKENFCLFHKGKITGEIYECPSCRTKYCLICAQKAKENGRKCIKCKNVIFIQKS